MSNDPKHRYWIAFAVTNPKTRQQRLRGEAFEFKFPLDTAEKICAACCIIEDSEASIGRVELLTWKRID